MYAPDICGMEANTLLLPLTVTQCFKALRMLISKITGNCKSVLKGSGNISARGEIRLESAGCGTEAGGLCSGVHRPGHVAGMHRNAGRSTQASAHFILKSPVQMLSLCMFSNKFIVYSAVIYT